MKAFLDKLDKLAPREKLLMTLSFLCVFSFLMDQCVVSSIMHNLRQMDSGIAQKKNDRDYVLRLLAREKETKAEYDRIAGSIIRAASPSEAMAGMKGEVYDAAKQSGVIIHAMDQRETRPKSFCDEYVLEITKFDAEMKNLLGFIYKLDTSGGMTKVLKLSITPGKTKNSVTGSILLSKVMIVDGAGRSRPVAPAGGGSAAGAPKR